MAKTWLPDWPTEQLALRVPQSAVATVQLSLVQMVRRVQLSVAVVLQVALQVGQKLVPPGPMRQAQQGWRVWPPPVAWLLGPGHP